jgi:hypothetical protein
VLIKRLAEKDKQPKRRRSAQYVIELPCQSTKVGQRELRYHP